MNSTKNIPETVWYLEMLSLEEQRKKPLSPETQLVRFDIPLPAMNRFFYTEVGKLWNWTNFASRTDEQWSDWIIEDKVETWMLLYKGTPAGYFELNLQDGNVELAHFGLLSTFIGQGLGGGLLSAAIEKAWLLDSVKRVWVHTCSLDHPSALQNYQARGLKIYKETIE